MVDRSAADEARAVVERIVRGRPIVLVGEVVAGTTGRIAELRELGASRFLVLASDRGTGPLPEGDDVEVVLYDAEPASDIVAGFRRQESTLANPPRAFLDALERFDREREAVVLAAPFVAVYDVAGRRVYGGRRREWVELEDKTRTDDVLIAAGVAVPDHEIVRSEPDALSLAASRLERGDGTVWAGDAREGFNGGSVFVRWVRNEDDRDEALAFFPTRCTHVRIAAFVEGIPSSIHGFVTGAGVAVFRPVEMVTLRSAAIPQFRYAGAATYWDPPPADRDAMRCAARRVGLELRCRVDYRGAFTVDGILSADGWVATECNPRFGAGLGYAGAACRELRLGLLHHVVAAGDGESIDPEAIERELVGAADAMRWGGTWTASPRRIEVCDSIDLAGDECGYHICSDDEPADVTFECGHGLTGGFVRGTFVRDRTPVGGSVAARAAAVLAFADEHVGAGFGHLCGAQPVR